MQHPTPAQIKLHVLKALYAADDDVRKNKGRNHLHYTEAADAIESGFRAAIAEKRAEADHVS